MFVSVNPATGREEARFAFHTAAEVETIVAAADAAQRAWKGVPVEERCALLRRIAATLRADAERLAGLATAEMGKPIVDARAEIEKCAVVCEFYARNAAAWLAPEAADTGADESLVRYDPLGVVLAIMPWNFPFWQVFRFAAPALAAGNGVLLKHAANVPRCALAIVELLRVAGLPDGLLGAVMIDSGEVAGLIRDPRVAGVTVTGSTAVGAKVAAEAGRALKKQVLELGGSDPFIVLADADIELAAERAAAARFFNAGQACINAKRFIVVDAVADEFVERFTAAARKLSVGDPADPATTMGPVARGDLRDALDRQVRRTLDEGATLMLGGAPVDGPGFFYQPTILDHVAPGMTASCEETFGPVAAIMRVPDEAAAIALANSTEYGLGASLWTQDRERARDLAGSIEAGVVFINAVVASDPRLPFGGIKRSGYGRELGMYGLREFMNVKSVWVG